MISHVRYTAVESLVAELIRIRGLAAHKEGQAILEGLDDGPGQPGEDSPAKKAKAYYDMQAFEIREGIEQILTIRPSKGD